MFTMVNIYMNVTKTSFGTSTKTSKNEIVFDHFV